MSVTTDIEKKFVDKYNKGEIVTLEDFIADRSKKIVLSKRTDDSVKKTANEMIDKIDQLVRLPAKTEEKNVILRQLKLLVKTRFDIQDMRKITFNRILMMFRHLMDIPSTATKEQQDRIADKLKAKILGEFAEIANLVGKNGLSLYDQKPGMQLKMLNKWFVDNADREVPLINDESEFYSIEVLARMIGEEARIEKRIAALLKHFPFYTECLEKVYGLGPMGGAMILSNLDIDRARTPGSFIRRLGITVEKDGKGTSRRKEHNVPTEYIDKDGNLAYKWGLGYDPQLRSWFLENMMGGFIRCDKRKGVNPWVVQYRNKKTQYSLRKDLMIKDKKTSELVIDKSHVDKMSRRWMLKIFLIDIWLFWAAFEGKEIKKPYYQAKINPSNHAGINNWNLMLSRLGNPLELREKIYGIQDSIPACYDE